MSEQPPAPRNGTLTGLLDRALKYMDTPWKAAVIVVLLVVCGVAWLIWDKRDELFEAWLTPDHAVLNLSLVPDAAAKLAEQTHADLVQIWSADLSTNRQEFQAARRYDGERAVIPSPRTLPIIDNRSEAQRLTDVLAGHPVCVDLEADGTPVVRRLKERGMTRGCAIPIPPSQEAFVGVIYLAWAVATDMSNENVAIGTAREIAKTLTK